MQQEKLVLFTPRSHRIAQGLIIPFLILPIGPLLQFLQGENYNWGIGFAAFFLSMLVIGWLNSRLAARFGGEWVSEAERVRRLRDEVVSNSKWTMPLTTAFSGAAAVFAVLLMVPPAQQSSDWHGILVYYCLPAGLVAIVGGIGNHLYNRKLVSAVPSEAVKPHASPRVSSLPIVCYLLACAAACAASLAIAKQFDGNDRRTNVYVVCVAVSMAAIVLISFMKSGPLTSAAMRPPLRELLLAGLFTYGLPLGFAFAGFEILQESELTAAECLELVADTVLFATFAGVFFGAFLYLFVRISDAKRDRTD